MLPQKAHRRVRSVPSWALIRSTRRSAAPHRPLKTRGYRGGELARQRRSGASSAPMSLASSLAYRCPPASTASACASLRALSRWQAGRLVGLQKLDRDAPVFVVRIPKYRQRGPGVSQTNVGRRRILPRPVRPLVATFDSRRRNVEQRRPKKRPASGLPRTQKIVCPTWSRLSAAGPPLAYNARWTDDAQQATRDELLSYHVGRKAWCFSAGI